MHVRTSNGCGENFSSQYPRYWSATKKTPAKILWRHSSHRVYKLGDIGMTNGQQATRNCSIWIDAVSITYSSQGVVWYFFFLFGYSKPLWILVTPALFRKHKFHILTAKKSCSLTQRCKRELPPGTLPTPPPCKTDTAILKPGPPHSSAVRPASISSSFPTTYNQLSIRSSFQCKQSAITRMMPLKLVLVVTKGTYSVL